MTVPLYVPVHNYIQPTISINNILKCKLSSVTLSLVHHRLMLCDIIQHQVNSHDDLVPQEFY